MKPWQDISNSSEHFEDLVEVIAILLGNLIVDVSARKKQCHILLMIQ